MDVPAGRSRTDRALLLLLVVLTVGVVLGGVLVWQTRADRAATETEQERYGEVVAAATAEAEAFVNIRYDDASSSLDRVAEGATGDFREQYTSSRDRVEQKIRRNRSVLEGEVLYTGVVDVDGNSATVLAATSGTVTSRQTDNQPVVREFRLRLELVRQGGRWLTSDLEVVE